MSHLYGCSEGNCLVRVYLAVQLFAIEERCEKLLNFRNPRRPTDQNYLVYIGLGQTRILQHCRNRLQALSLGVDGPNAL